MDLGLTDRHLVVTGGTAGLGLAVARVLVEEGARVTVASRDPARVEAAAAELGAAGVVVDLTAPDASTRLLDAAEAANGPLHGGFVSHGGPPPGPATELDDARLDAALAGSVLAPVRVVRDLVARLDDGGAVAVLTSMTSVQPIAGLASSNVARPAVWGYVKALADEVAPRGVRVNVVLPGRFATERLAELEADVAEREGTTPAAVRAEAVARVPLRRLGDPAELGRVAAFLLSPAASYVTGSAWAVDGGAVRGL
ncbi:MAG: SDR family oxidoreductase [Actinomycetes bacterium]